MKISFCLSYSSLLIPINTFTICYAVVNLRFASVNRLIRWVCTHLSLSGGGLKWTFWHLVASQPSGRAILSLLLAELVGSNGLGPSTSRLSGVCSNQLSYEPIRGGGNRVRTDDPLLAGQVLYQLSYTPVFFALLRK